MKTKKQPVRSFSWTNWIGISPRLIVCLTLYVTLLMLFTIALLYAPILLLAGSLLAAAVADIIKRFRQRNAPPDGAL